MPVTQVDTDIEHRTLTITAEFAARVERVRAIYADTRQLEEVCVLPPTLRPSWSTPSLRAVGCATT